MTGTFTTTNFSSFMLESSPTNGEIFREILGNLVIHFRSAASAPAVHHSRDAPNAQEMGIRKLTGCLLSNTERASVYACSEKKIHGVSNGLVLWGQNRVSQFLVRIVYFVADLQADNFSACKSATKYMIFVRNCDTLFCPHKTNPFGTPLIFFQNMRRQTHVRCLITSMPGAS